MQRATSQTRRLEQWLPAAIEYWPPTSCGGRVRLWRLIPSPVMQATGRCVATPRRTSPRLPPVLIARVPGGGAFAQRWALPQERKPVPYGRKPLAGQANSRPSFPPTPHEAIRPKRGRVILCETGHTAAAVLR